MLVCAESELLIYEAARAQIIREVIIPALARGAVVLLDRFYDSTIAYQVYGRGLPMSFVRQANSFACQGVHPCRTILLTTGASAEEGLERATHHGDADRLEQAGTSFHARVNNGFLAIAAENPERIRVVNSSGTKDETARAIFTQIKDIFGWGAIPSYGKKASSTRSFSVIPAKRRASIFPRIDAGGRRIREHLRSSSGP